MPDSQEARSAATSSEPRQFTEVEWSPPCPRCGFWMGEGVTHVCLAPSNTSLIVPGYVLMFPIGGNCDF